jgi:hypothetical protein
MKSNPRSRHQSKFVKPAMMSDPYVMGMVAPMLPYLDRMVARMQDADMVASGGVKRKHEVEFLAAGEANVVTVPGFRQVSMVTERYSVRVNDKPVVAVEVKTMTVGDDVYDMEVLVSWHPLVEVEMSAMLMKMQVETLALLFGLGLGLSPKVQQMPGMLVVHLGQRKPQSAAVAPANHSMGVHAAEAACAEPHGEWGPMPVVSSAPCDDSNPNFDVGQCAGCTSHARCHPAAHQEARQPLRKAA